MRTNINKKYTNERDRRRQKMKGFSLVELIIVLVIIAVLSAVSLPYLLSYKRLFKSEDQALKVMDLMREANQLALTRHRTFRFEIDINENKALIIDENSSGAADDKEIKAIPLEHPNEVTIETVPTGVSKPNPPNYNDAVFAIDNVGHKRGTTTITGHKVWVARFRTDGAVVKSDGTLVSATLYFWSPLSPGNAAPRNIKEVRAVTMFGGSGAVRYWKHNGTTFLPF